ncbi:hypothetical protein ACFV1F_00875, partial [Streptomyces sp. NPDC059590]
MALASTEERIEDKVAAVFEAVGARGRLHAVGIGGGREVAVGADEPVVIASVFKILLVLEFARQSGAGQHDPRARGVSSAGDPPRGGGPPPSPARDELKG